MSGKITPQLFGLLGGAVDEGVDRLASHGPQTRFVASFQPARNLSGRPSFRKAIVDEGLQRLIFFEDGFTPPAQLIGSGGVKRRIAPARQGVASQFPRYGGFGSLKRPGGGAGGVASYPHHGDFVSFLTKQNRLAWQPPLRS